MNNNDKNTDKRSVQLGFQDSNQTVPLKSRFKKS